MFTTKTGPKEACHTTCQSSGGCIIYCMPSLLNIPKTVILGNLTATILRQCSEFSSCLYLLNWSCVWAGVTFLQVVVTAATVYFTENKEGRSYYNKLNKKKKRMGSVSSLFFCKRFQLLKDYEEITNCFYVLYRIQIQIQMLHMSKSFIFSF